MLVGGIFRIAAWARSQGFYVLFSVLIMIPRLIQSETPPLFLHQHTDIVTVSVR